MGFFSCGKNNFTSSSNVTEDITEASQSVCKSKLKSGFLNKNHAAFIKKFKRTEVKPAFNLLLDRLPILYNFPFSFVNSSYAVVVLNY